MKRCPKCGSGAECINKLSYYGTHAAGFIAGGTAAVVTSLFSRSHASHVGHHIWHEMNKSNHKEYKCTNPRCEYEWSESNE